MVSDNPEFYKALYRRIKQYGPVTCLVVNILLTFTPIVVGLIDTALNPSESEIFPPFVFSYMLFLIHLSVFSFFLNKNWKLRVISFAVWGWQIYWFVFFLLVYAFANAFSCR